MICKKAISLRTRIADVILTVLLTLVMAAVLAPQLNTARAYGATGIDYYKEADRDMLPGWWNTIQSEGSGYDYDKGQDFTYQIVNVEVTNGADLIGTPPTSRTGWEYSIKEPDELGTKSGTVTFKVTFEYPSGNQQSYTFNVNVVNEVYDVWIRSVSGSYNALPGESIDIAAEGRRYYIDSNNEEQCTTSDLGFLWDIESGTNYAGLIAGGGNADTAKLTFNACTSGDTSYTGEVSVRVRAYDLNDPNKTPKASDTRCFNTAYSYYEISPTQGTPDLDIGDSETFTCQVNHYIYGQQPVAVDKTYKVKYSSDISSDDSDYFDVKWNGSQCTVTRKANNGMWWLPIKAVWNDGTDDHELNIEYRYSEKSYDDVRFEEQNHEYGFFNGETSTCVLNMDDTFGSNWANKYYIDFTVGIGNWDGNTDTFVWDVTFTEGAEYTVNGNKVTLDGAKIAAAGYADREIRVFASIKVKRTGNEVINCECFHMVREETVNYSGLDENSIIVQGGTMGISSNGNYEVWNRAYPQGASGTYNVSAVSVRSQSPDKAGEDVVKLEPVYSETDPSEIVHWNVSGVGCGSAVIEVEHTDYEGKAGALTLVNVKVVSEMTEVWIDRENNKDIGVPGDTINLTARAEYRYADGNGECQIVNTGFNFTWSHKDGDSSLYDIKVDPSDSSKATVTLKAPANANGEFEEHFTIGVEGSVDIGGATHAAASEVELRVRDENYEIEPVSVNNPDIGSSVKIEPSLIKYTYGQASQTVSNVEYKISFNNSGECEVTDNNGKILSDGDILTGSAVNVKRTGDGWFTVWIDAETPGYDESQDWSSSNRWYAGRQYDFENKTTAPEVIPASGTSTGESGKKVEAVVEEVKDGNAVVKAVSKEELAGAASGEPVTVDAAGKGGSSETVSSVTITKDTAENIVASSADGIRIKLDNASVQFDDKALDAVVKSAEGDSLKLVVEIEQKAEKNLTAEQTTAVENMKDALVIEATLVSGGKTITDFGGGTVTVRVRYETEKTIRAWYIASDGSKEEIPCVKDGDYAVLTLKHFSHYAVEAYDPADDDVVKDGSEASFNGSKYVVLSADKRTAALVRAKNVKNFVVPASIRIGDKSYKVTQINAGAFKGKKIRKVTIGKNVRKIRANAFKGSKATALVLKTRLLKKAGVKGCLKGSKIRTIKISIGKKLNKTYIAKYRKIFTKAIAGARVRVG